MSRTFEPGAQLSGADKQYLESRGRTLDEQINRQVWNNLVLAGAGTAEDQESAWSEFRDRNGDKR